MYVNKNIKNNVSNWSSRQEISKDIKDLNNVINNFVLLDIP